MTKRVLQLIGSFNQGGSERQAIALTRLLKNDGTFDVLAAALNKEGVLRPDIETLGLPEIREFPLRSFYDLNFVRKVKQCAGYIRKNKIELVQTHDFYTNIFGAAASRLAGIKQISSKRETGGMRSNRQDIIEKLAFGRSHAIVVNSESVRKHLLDRGVAADKLNLIYNGLDFERFRISDLNKTEILRKFGLPNNETARFVTLVANLRHEVKNVPMLLRAAKRVVESQANVYFIVAGEGELENELRQLAESLGVNETVHFIGRCSEIPELLAASNIGVLTSTAEGFSNSILEYLAAGRPVVATDVGGAREAVEHGINGYLVDSDDDESMAARVIDLLSDHSKSTAFGLAGKRIAHSKFSESAQLQNHLRLYHSLLG